jgi:hypothetical protein
VQVDDEQIGAQGAHQIIQAAKEMYEEERKKKSTKS